MNPPAIQEVSEAGKQAHDAGFDAYMTGAVFIRLASKFLLEKKGLLWVYLFNRIGKSEFLLHNTFVNSPSW